MARLHFCRTYDRYYYYFLVNTARHFFGNFAPIVKKISSLLRIDPNHRPPHRCMPPPIICVGSLVAVALLLLLSSGITLDPPTPAALFVQFSPPRGSRLGHHRRPRRRRIRRGDRLEDNKRQHRGEELEERQQREEESGRTTTSTTEEAAGIDETTMVGHDISSSDCDEEIVESFSRLPSISSSSYQGRHSLYNFAIENEGIMRPMSAMVERCGGTGTAFDVNLSTQENYRAEGNELYGEFREIRAGLDRDYHGEFRVFGTIGARRGRGGGGGIVPRRISVIFVFRGTRGATVRRRIGSHSTRPQLIILFDDSPRSPRTSRSRHASHRRRSNL